MTDLYETLGVAPDADTAAIKKAYRRQAKQAHPDTAGGSEDKFHKITRAYLVLRDPDKRARYDRTGSVEGDGSLLDSVPLAMISAVFQRIVNEYIAAEGTVLVVGDFLKIICNEIQEENLQALKFVSKRKRELKKLEALAKRFSKKGKGNNVFHQLLKTRERDAQLDIERANQAVAYGKEALTILADYSFETDGRAPTELMRKLEPYMKEKGL